MNTIKINQLKFPNRPISKVEPDLVDLSKPIIIDQNNNIIDGVYRVKAAMKLGRIQIPYERFVYDPKKIKTSVEWHKKYSQFRIVLKIGTRKFRSDWTNNHSIARLDFGDLTYIAVSDYWDGLLEANCVYTVSKSS